ncbi:ABC transporter permease [Arachnia propionica]|uniref:ABC transporter permease n=1 Tax=Arachnia propionica TaxID=1750 RepID=UPI0021AB1226|nr:ABC transporter permease [Arachnia propionica]
MNTHTRPSFWSTVSIVAQREIKVRFLSKAFIIGTLVTLAVMLAVVVLGPRLGDFFSGGAPSIAATAEHAQIVTQIPDAELVEVADDAAARQAVLDETAKAAVVSDPSNPLGIKVLSLRDLPTSLLQSLSVAPQVELLDPNAQDPAFQYFLSVAFGAVWMMAGITFGMSIAQSVVEEKQTRIVEILLASVSSKALLTGKIIGNSIAALVQISLIAATVLLGLAINGDSLPVGDLLAPILVFVPLFLLGFVMIASMYAAAAALVSRTEDLNSVVQPMVWTVMLPYFGVIAGNSNQALMTAMSYIPFSAPVAVPIQLFLGRMEWWQVGVSAALLVATTVVVILFAARVYDRGLLQTGKPMKWKEALAKAS